MFFVKGFLFLSFGFTISLAEESAVVKCSPTQMRIEVPISSKTRQVYIQGLRDYPDIACRPHIDENTAVFNLGLDDVFRCAVTRAVSAQMAKTIYYQTIIIENKEEDGHISKETLQVKCTIQSVTNHTIAKRNVLPAGFQEPDIKEMDILSNNQTIGRAPEPKLSVGVRQAGKLVTGELNVSPGTPLQMEIFLDETSAPIYGLLVTHMQVTDTKSQEETIIYNGCAVDPYLFENFNTIDGDFLTAKFKAFKFPESTYVQFKGTVNVCLDKCKGVECSDGQTGYGRRKRAISELPPDPNKIFEISITSFIKVGSDNGDMTNNEKIYNNKKLIVGNQMSDVRGEEVLLPDLPSQQILDFKDEEKYTSIVADNSSAEKLCQSSLLLITILNFFYI